MISSEVTNLENQMRQFDNLILRSVEVIWTKGLIFCEFKTPFPYIPLPAVQARCVQYVYVFPSVR